MVRMGTQEDGRVANEVCNGLRMRRSGSTGRQKGGELAYLKSPTPATATREMPDQLNPMGGRDIPATTP